MQTLLQDLRYGVRMLLKKPGFTLIAIFTLALGIGANTAIFSLVNETLLRPLPIENPAQLVSLNLASLKTNNEVPVFSYPAYRDLRNRNRVFSGLIAYRTTPISLSHEGRNERVWGYLVSGNYFSVLGIKAERGRLLTPEDDKTPGAHPVAVITHACWQKRFASDPNILGKEVIINGRKFSIIGIAAPGFYGSEIALNAEIWFPMMMQRVIEPSNDYLEARGSENIFVQGRLQAGITMKQAEADVQAIAAQLAKDFPQNSEGATITLSPPGLFGSFFRTSILGFTSVMMLVVLLVLLLACTNLANLLMARATERRKEIAVRLAIGAGRVRLIRQLLTESILLSVLGGALGILLAYWMLDALVAYNPPMDIPISTKLHLDYRVLIFALLVSLLTGIVFGLLPALQSTNPNVVGALKEETTIGGKRRAWLRNGLVILQMSLSLVLLICAGLVLRGLQQAQFINPGFITQNAVELSFDLSLQGYDDGRTRAFKKQLIERVRALPNVQAVGLTNFMPLSMNLNYQNVFIEGRPEERGANVPSVFSSRISAGYQEAMGVQLVHGRDFTEQDAEGELQTAIVNETFARKFWNTDNVIGKRFSTESVNGPWREIVGVVRDGKYFSLSEEAAPIIFRALQSQDGSYLTLVARATGDQQNAINAIRQEIQALDGNLPVYNAKTLTKHMDLPLFPARIAASLLGSFGLLALLLAAIGLFGVMSYAVTQRTREIGIRMALGANTVEILKLVMGQGILLTVIGVAIGLVLAFLGTNFLASLLYGVSALDALTFISVSAILLLIAFSACYLPARKATKVDPMIALRCE